MRGGAGRSGAEPREAVLGGARRRGSRGGRQRRRRRWRRRRRRRRRNGCRAPHVVPALLRPRARGACGVGLASVRERTHMGPKENNMTNGMRSAAVSRCEFFPCEQSIVVCVCSCVRGVALWPGAVRCAGPGGDRLDAGPLPRLLRYPHRGLRRRSPLVAGLLLEAAWRWAHVGSCLFVSRSIRRVLGRPWYLVRAASCLWCVSASLVRPSWLCPTSRHLWCWLCCHVLVCG